MAKMVKTCGIKENVKKNLIKRSTTRK